MATSIFPPASCVSAPHRTHLETLQRILVLALNYTLQLSAVSNAGCKAYRAWASMVASAGASGATST